MNDDNSTPDTIEAIETPVQEIPPLTLEQRQQAAKLTWERFQATLEAQFGMRVIPNVETETFTNQGKVMVQTTLTLNIEPTR